MSTSWIKLYNQFKLNKMEVPGCPEIDVFDKVRKYMYSIDPSTFFVRFCEAKKVIERQNIR